MKRHLLYGCGGALYVWIERHLYAPSPPFGRLISSWFSGNLNRFFNIISTYSFSKLPNLNRTLISFSVLVKRQLNS